MTDSYEIYKMIEKVCPIIGMSFNSIDKVEIQYGLDATDEQKEAAQKIISNLPITLAKIEKLKQINNEFEFLINQGWDSKQGFNLGLRPEDVSLLVGLFVLAKEGSALGLNPPPVIDTEGNSHQFTIEELTIIMLQYGNYRANLSQNYASRKKRVEDANDINELENI